MAERTEETGVSPMETSDRVLEQMDDEIPHDSNPPENDEKAPEKSAPQPQKPPDGGEKKPSKLKQMWEKTGLDP
jgi:hypothetical protein